MSDNNKIIFPKGFYWGTATAAHQVEGNNTNSDWWAWEQEEIKSQHPKIKDVSGQACGHFERFQEDFDWAKKLGQNAHRLSIEWARIEPRQGEWSFEAVNHYKQVFEALRERGIEPFVTAMHFTLPRWVADQGGWLSPEMKRFYARYVEFLIENFGDTVKYWMTMNEPLVLADMGFREGKWAPGKKTGWLGTFGVLRNMVRTHRTAYTAMKNKAKELKCDIEVGIAHNLVAMVPYNHRSIKDVLLAKFLHWAFLNLYLRFFNGHEDFFGVNFYFTTRAHFDLRNKAAMLWGLNEKEESVSDMGWAIRPSGIFKVLKDVSKFKKPIYITENGIADVQDKYRAEFIINHLKFVHKAIEHGADIRGYFYWSLIDNFEWADGFMPRFGLLAVDYSTLSRTARQSALVYKEICENNGIIS